MWLQGRLPFRAKDQSGLFKAIVKGVYDPLPDSFSAPLKHIMKGMLMVNPVSVYPPRRSASNVYACICCAVMTCGLLQRMPVFIVACMGAVLETQLLRCVCTTSRVYLASNIAIGPTQPC